MIVIRSYLTTGLYTYNTLQYDIYTLLKRYFPLVRLNILNITADGRSIYCLKVGNSKGKKILINASCHGREYMNSMLIMNQLRYTLERYPSEVFNRIQLIIIPMVNPDGVSISQFGARVIHNKSIQSRVQSILDSNSISHKFWKSNAMGVDINRNFSTDYWDTFNDDILKPSYKFFKGYSSCSEIETYTLQNLCTSLDNLKMVISYHSSGEEIYFNYGQSGLLLNDTMNILNVLQSTTGYSKANPSLQGVGFSDWIVQTLKIPAFTIETGIGDCPLDILEYPKIWKDNKNLLIDIFKIYV